MINIALVEIVQVICAYRHVENGRFVGPAYYFFLMKDWLKTQSSILLSDFYVF
jgi:hypothetical protein